MINIRGGVISKCHSKHERHKYLFCLPGGGRRKKRSDDTTTPTATCRSISQNYYRYELSLNYLRGKNKQTAGSEWPLLTTPSLQGRIPPTSARAKCFVARKIATKTTSGIACTVQVCVGREGSLLLRQLGGGLPGREQTSAVKEGRSVSE